MRILLTAAPLKLQPLALGAVALVATAVCLASSASAQSCRELWRARNSIYARAGYCFKTADAIAEFGNRGCIYDNEADVPLSRSSRARILEIRRLERRLGCG